MSAKYASIETVWVRDKATNILDFGNHRNLVNECIGAWDLTEKIDGTNIRVICTDEGMAIKGRTDNADIPSGLEATIRGLLDLNRIRQVAAEVAEKALWEGWNLTVYGEGYGAGIQSGGAYSPTKTFAAFDVLLSNRYWLKPADFRVFCEAAGIPTVPALGVFTGLAIPATLEELDALIPTSRFGTSGAEGVVAKPLENLFDEFGDRVMWKLTKREWKNVAH